VVAGVGRWRTEWACRSRPVAGLIQESDGFTARGRCRFGSASHSPGTLAIIAILHPM